MAMTLLLQLGIVVEQTAGSSDGSPDEYYYSLNMKPYLSVGVISTVVECTAFWRHRVLPELKRSMISSGSMDSVKEKNEPMRPYIFFAPVAHGISGS